VDGAGRETRSTEALCPTIGKPEDIHIVVTGDPGKHSAFIPTFGTSKSVTRRVDC
jgi:hypothetical protein